MIGQILFSVTGMVTSWLDSKETTDQLFHRYEFSMPTAAFEGHVIVDYGFKLGHVIWILGICVIYYGNINTHFSLCCSFPAWVR